MRKNQVFSTVVILIIFISFGSACRTSNERKQYNTPKGAVKATTKPSNEPKGSPKPEPAPETAKPVTPTTATSLSWGPRKALQDQWMQAAIRLANDTKDQEALQVVDLLQTRSLLAIPRHSKQKDKRSKIEILESNGREDWIGVIPVMADDKEADQEWFDSLEEEAFAFMNNLEGQSQMIVLKDSNDMGNFSKGLIFIHEGLHAVDLRSDEAEGLSKREVTELHCQEMGMRVTEKKFGAVFKEAGDTLAATYIQLYKKGSMAKFLSTGVDLEETMIVEIFGKPKSDREKLLFLTILSTYGKFRAIETLFSGESARQKKLEYVRLWLKKYDEKNN